MKKLGPAGHLVCKRDDQKYGASKRVIRCYNTWQLDATNGQSDGPFKWATDNRSVKNNFAVANKHLKTYFYQL